MADFLVCSGRSAALPAARVVSAPSTGASSSASLRSARICALNLTRCTVQIARSEGLKQAARVSLELRRVESRRGKNVVRRSLSVCAGIGAVSDGPIDALIFDCDGVILESEDLHRCAYNAAFEHFNVCCPGETQPAVWTTEFYDILQNTIGGGKPKMRWYFNENGWPSSIVLSEAPESDEAKAILIDTLQDWKTAKYKDMIGSGEVKPRPGVLRLMDEAREKGLKLAVCSAATKSSVVFVLENLIGNDRFLKLDCFLAGDDVDKKKPDPTIYKVAAEKLGVEPSRCLVVEDSTIGLQAALGAGMRCICTYTSSTKSQSFDGAAEVYPDLTDVNLELLLALPQLVKA